MRTRGGAGYRTVDAGDGHPRPQAERAVADLGRAFKSVRLITACRAGSRSRIETYSLVTCRREAPDLPPLGRGLGGHVGPFAGAGGAGDRRELAGRHRRGYRSTPGRGRRLGDAAILVAARSGAVLARDPGGPDALVAELRAVGGREADVRLFTTLMQFDALYQATSRAIGRNWPRCRCSGRTRANFSRPRLRRHHRLRPHQAALLLVHRDINPTGIVPVGPDRRVDKPARPGGARRAAVRRRNATAASPARGDDPARAHPARRLARLQPPLVLEDQVERRGE